MKTSGKERIVETDESHIEDTNEQVEAACLGIEVFENTVYGQVQAAYVVYPDAFGQVRDGAIMLTRMVPYGMAMTQYRRELLGFYPMKNPTTVH
jgi:hypothetical protein